METVFGVKWPTATPIELTLLVILFLVVGLIFLILKYIQHQKDRQLHDYNLFLFRTKRLGLSNFQIKVLNNIINILHLSNPSDILRDPELFEEATGKFLTFLKNQHEEEKSFSSICKDLTITYEKLYHGVRFKKPLNSLMELEINQLLYFNTAGEETFFGKILSISNNGITLKLFRSPKELQALVEPQPVKFYIWRVGDAEYTFDTMTEELEGNLLTVIIPESFTRDKEFRHPYLDVIIPCTVKINAGGTKEEIKEENGTVFKINDYEAVVRLGDKMDYKEQYALSFAINEFKFDILTQIISSRTIAEGNVFYYTMKFEDISEAARNVLKNYIYEHL